MTSTVHSVADPLGPLLRLWGVTDSQLPPATATAEDLVPLLEGMLKEATSFIGDVPSRQQSPNTSSWLSKGSKKFPHSEAPVHLYERTVPADVLKTLSTEQNHTADRLLSRPETWWLRRSVHSNAAETGTASWDEWMLCFKAGHAETEMEFTPTVISTKEWRRWDCTGVEIRVPNHHGQGPGRTRGDHQEDRHGSHNVHDDDEQEDVWENWTLHLGESVHRMPAPLLKPRAFPVLMATMSRRGHQEFMVIQLAADRVKDAVKRDEDHPPVVVGAYTSVERFKNTLDGIEWIMGTVSDARGVLPPWMQKMAMPGPIAKDVELFLSWISGQRRHEGQNEKHNGSQDRVQDGSQNGKHNGVHNGQSKVAQNGTQT